MPSSYDKNLNDPFDFFTYFISWLCQDLKTGEKKWQQTDQHAFYQVKQIYQVEFFPWTTLLDNLMRFFKQFLKSRLIPINYTKFNLNFCFSNSTDTSYVRNESSQQWYHFEDDDIVRQVEPKDFKAFLYIFLNFILVDISIKNHTKNLIQEWLCSTSRLSTSKEIIK